MGLGAGPTRWKGIIHGKVSFRSLVGSNSQLQRTARLCPLGVWEVCKDGGQPSYAQQVLVERLDILSSLRNTLPTTAAICRHSDIVHVHLLPDATTKGTRYVWVHPQIRPWGHQLPVQCPDCRCIHPWKASMTGSDRLFACLHCHHKLVFGEPKEEHCSLGVQCLGEDGWQ